jgi:muconolactone D-isomerase
MEYLVSMTTHVPDGTPEEAVQDIRAREAAHSRELTAQGHLLRLWRPPLQPGEWRTLGLFAAADGDHLEEVLASMPLRVWRTDEVTPLSPHPNDPPRAPTSSAVPVGHGAGGNAISDKGQKVAIITGGSQGIGASLVTAYRRQGWSVVATARIMKPAEDPRMLTVDGDLPDPPPSAGSSAEHSDASAASTRSSTRRHLHLQAVHRLHGR